MFFRRSVVVAMLLLYATGTAFAQQGKSLAESRATKYPPLPDDVERISVTIWSDGTRMAGDVYRPRDLKPTDKLPAVVFVHGTGGVKKAAFSARLGAAFARNGYLFLNFDYRGWGESDSKLLMLEKMPEPNEKGEVTVRARAIRWQMDFQDQTTDVRNAIAFMSGEPDVDRERLGIFGTSYGGGLVTWTAAHDPRVKCAAVQVPGMGGGRGLPYYQYAYGLMTRQARGETEPVPYEQGAPVGKMASYAHMRYNPAKDVAFDAIEAAQHVKIPMLIIDAGKEELMDISKNGGRVAEILKARGTPVEYHVIPDIGHYGVYGNKFDDVLKMELDWFDEHLKPAASARPKSDPGPRNSRDREATRASPASVGPADHRPSRALVDGIGATDAGCVIGGRRHKPLLRCSRVSSNGPFSRPSQVREWPTRLSSERTNAFVVRTSPRGWYLAKFFERDKNSSLLRPPVGLHAGGKYTPGLFRRTPGPARTNMLMRQ
jgi:dienelactone hydrolase